VQVQVDTVSSGISPFRKLDIIVDVIVSLDGIHPQALPDRIDAIVRKDILQGLRFAVKVLVLDPGFFLDQQRRYVYPTIRESSMSNQGQ
jgi:hypothetical protein